MQASGRPGCRKRSRGSRLYPNGKTRTLLAVPRVPPATPRPTSSPKTGSSRRCGKSSRMGTATMGPIATRRSGKIWPAAPRAPTSATCGSDHRAHRCGSTELGTSPAPKRERSLSPAPASNERPSNRRRNRGGRVIGRGARASPGRIGRHAHASGPSGDGPPAAARHHPIITRQSRGAGDFRSCAARADQDPRGAPSVTTAACGRAATRDPAPRRSSRR